MPRAGVVFPLLISNSQSYTHEHTELYEYALYSMCYVLSCRVFRVVHGMDGQWGRREGAEFSITLSPHLPLSSFLPLSSLSLLFSTFSLLSPTTCTCIVPSRHQYLVCDVCQLSVRIPEIHSQLASPTYTFIHPNTPVSNLKTPQVPILYLYRPQSPKSQTTSKLISLPFNFQSKTHSSIFPISSILHPHQKSLNLQILQQTSTQESIRD